MIAMKKTNLNEQDLKDALFIYYGALTTARYSQTTEYYNKSFTLDKNHELKLLKLIKKQRKPYYYMINTLGKRVAVVLFSFLLVVSTVLSVKALRDSVLNFIIETYEKFSTIFWDDKINSNVPITIEKCNLPSHIPSNYKQSLIIESDTLVSYKYTDDSNTKHYFIFQQYTIHNTVNTIDTEDIYTENIKINDKSGVFYCNKDIANLIWDDGAYGYTITGNIEKEEIIKIASSIS